MNDSSLLCLNALCLRAILLCMKDCTSCEHRAEINPQYIDAPWESTPCASCELTEPPRHHMIEYGDQFEHPSEGTWEIKNPLEAAEDATERASTLLEYLGASTHSRATQRLLPPNEVVSAFVGRFHPWQEDDIIDEVFNWHRSEAAAAKDRERSRVAQWKAMRKIERIIESMRGPVRFELGAHAGT